MVSCTIFSQWPPKGPKRRKSENRKSTMVIFFFAARPHVIWSFWSQISQGITMWTPTCQLQNFPFLPNYHPPLFEFSILVIQRQLSIWVIPNTVKLNSEVADSSDCQG